MQAHVRQNPTNGGGAEHEVAFLDEELFVKNNSWERKSQFSLQVWPPTPINHTVADGQILKIVWVVQSAQYGFRNSEGTKLGRYGRGENGLEGAGGEHDQSTAMTVVVCFLLLWWIQDQTQSLPLLAHRNYIIRPYCWRHGALWLQGVYQAGTDQKLPLMRASFHSDGRYYAGHICGIPQCWTFMLQYQPVRLTGAYRCNGNMMVIGIINYFLTGSEALHRRDSMLTMVNVVKSPWLRRS